jgi:serine/threonine protein kinase/WD40 repeat protein
VTQPRKDGHTDRPDGPPAGRSPAKPATTTQKTIGNYVLKKKLGEGAAGQVFLAHDRVLDRDVALKFLRTNIAGNEASVREFLKEARATARLNHPNIVTVHQAGKEAGRVFIAMEYVESGSLADEVKTHGALPWREATQAIRDACAGLQVAHESGLVHRDIKPSNLMRSSRRVVKVVDFGLARVEGGDAEATRTLAGTVLGSPGYMSPEQCRGEPADARSDLYSLTCSYYQFLTRQLPFSADSLAGMIYHHCNTPFPDASAIIPGLPDAVLRILAKGSAKNPAERYQSAAQMLAEVDAVLATPEVSLTFDRKAATKTAGKHRSAAGQRSMRKLIWATIAAVLVIGAATPIAVHYHQTDRNAAQSPAAQQTAPPFAHNAISVTQAPPDWALRALPGVVRTFPWPGEEAPQWVQVTPDLRHILARGKNGAMLWDSESGKVLGPAAGDGPRWIGGTGRLLSDDKRLLVEKNSRWAFCDVQTGAELSELADHIGYRSSLSANDSRLLTYDQKLGSVAMFDLTTGHLLAEIRLQFDLEKSPVLSPDGRTFVAAPMWTDFVMHAWDAISGKELWHAESKRGSDKLTFTPDGKLLFRVAHGTGAFLHDAKTGRVVAECLTNARASDGVIASDGRFIVMGFWDTPWGIRLFEPATAINGTVKETIWPPQTHGFGVNAVALSHDDRQLLVASKDNVLRVFEVPSGKLEFLFRQDADVTCAAFSADGRFAISGDAKAIHLWRLADLGPPK